MQDQEILEEFKLLEESSSFISENFLALQKKYGNKFIAIKDSSVLVSAESFNGLIEEIGAKGIKIEEVIVQFIPALGQIILY